MSDDPFAKFLSDVSINVGDPGLDYDHAAAQAAALQKDERGHMADTYKLPNHITFSDQSVYHGRDGNEGGRWTQVDGRDVFTPGPTNLKHHSIQEMMDYFAHYEPGVILNVGDDRNANP